MPVPPMPIPMPCCPGPTSRPEPFSPVPVPGGAAGEIARKLRADIDALKNGKADKAAGAAEGNLAALDENGNLVDSGVPKDGVYLAPEGGIPKSDLAGDVQASLGKADTALQEHQDVSGKAEKSEMSVTPGTGANADKTTIQLKSGTSATVLVAHQDIGGKADLVDGTVPPSQLPSYVDDVLEYASASAFPATGEAGKIYIALDTNVQYRWSGTRYSEIAKIVPPSTATPAMDGAGSAGSSNAYARGDHVHPTDTTRVPTSRTVNGKALSADVVLTGADIAVSGTDATKIDAALEGKATEADATLTERTGFSAWTFSPSTYDGHRIEMRIEEYEEVPGYHFYVPYANGSQIGGAHWDVEDFGSATRLEWGGESPAAWAGDTDSLVATRTALQGYQLGSQTSKPLASEAEAEALRTGKANLTDGKVPTSELPDGTANGKGIVQLASPSTASSASGKAADAKATGDALAGKANDNAVVKLTGDQTVEGAKTFTSGVTVNDASGISVVDPSISAMAQFKQSGIEVYPPDSPSYVLQYPVLAGVLALYLQIGVPAFDSTKTYDVGAKVVYDNAVWNCMTQVTTAGAWSTVGSNFTKLFDLAVDSTPTTNSSNLMTSGAIKNALAAADPKNKLNSTAAAPDFSAAATYDVGNRVTYLGVLYECVVAKTTASATTPDQDIYDSTHTTNHWKVTDMTTPDATLDVTSAGALRVVGSDGTLLWQQGYNLNATSSATQSNEGVNCYAFAQDAVAPVALSLPTVTSGKVGDFILDVTNPSLGSPFSTTASYAVGDRVIYNGAVYTCTTAHTGAWSASDFGTDPTYAAFSASSTYAVDALAVYDGKLWKCHTAVSTAGAWTGTANWQTASFTIAELTGNSISVVVPSGRNLTDMLTIGPGYTELYFTLTAFQIGGKPTWKVMRQDVENGGAQA